ncbi:DNA-3-methyladenine glycosylase I [Acinetobacter sp. B10A]|uniref:DNA-3-methyladenine glycosylase I n=1 Tax=Acinetobacter baretiae TaxID=2605383 RepID=UPI001B3C82B7|nr:DNA-3-methyladenine glycosylase I [Acinetobacter baretiae]MBF7685679.1 DNA-3-methyladenine glycosylase I [Acinetobacter baretiae]
MTNTNTSLPRCSWCTQDPLYMSYHDLEWGKPIHHEAALFELLCLEGQQAGLSWLTVLKKRACYRSHFFNHSIAYIALLSDQDIIHKCTDQGLIRHLGKLKSIRDNAIAWQNLQCIYPNMSEWLWSFAEYPTPIHHQPMTYSTQSQKLSQILKKHGFKFVGPTICYAFMQASGMVNDHEKDCWLAQKNTLSHHE